MEIFLNTVLPGILYIVAIILIIVLIIVGIKLIETLNKVNRIADNVEDKINTFNGALAVLKSASDGIATISDTVVSSVTSLITRLVGKVKKDHKEEEDYE